MRTIIIEDELLIRNMIVNYVKKNPHLEYIGDASTVSEGIVLVNACKPDLLLLDIQLKDGTSFELLENINFKTKVIFITAYQEFALKALKLGALDYILKPVDFNELNQIITKIIDDEPKTEQLQETQNHFKGHGTKIILKSIERMHIVNFDEIIYCQSNGSYTTFCLKDKKDIVMSKNIKEYENILPQTEFVRCHNSFIVNINQIDQITRDNELSLKNGERIPISIRKKDKLIEMLEK
jgi:two-component system, LytTR family, response regulator